MNENFVRLKKRCLIEALIKSAAAGISAAVLTVGVFLLAFGLAEVGVHWAVYIPIGVVVAAACGGLTFFFLRPTDIKIAKKYDNEYSLNERIQTMVAYAEQDGDIVALQREDTEEKLKGVKSNGFKFGRIWQYCVIFLLALAMLFTGVFVPAAAFNGDDTPPKTEEPEPDHDAFTYDLYMQAAMAELIVNVRDSSLRDTDKNAVVSELETLDGNLKGIETKSLMKSAVSASVSRIDGIFENANSFRRIRDALTEENLSKAVMDGVAVFATGGTDYGAYRNVKAFEARVGDYIDIVLEPLLEKPREDLKVSQTEGMGEKIDALIEIINSALIQSEVDESDSLYTAFVSLRRALRSTYDKIGKGSGNGVLWGEIDTAFENFSNDLNAALGVQSYYCVMDLFVRIRLSDIFGITYSELPEVNEDIEGGNGSGSDDDPNGGGSDIENPGGDGGSGNKNEIYGSDDVIYSPDDADYVKYGEVLREYYAEVYDKILSGEASEELIKLVEEYFNILFSGIKDDSEEN